MVNMGIVVPRVNHFVLQIYLPADSFVSVVMDSLVIVGVSNLLFRKFIVLCYIVKYLRNSVILHHYFIYYIRFIDIALLTLIFYYYP